MIRKNLWNVAILLTTITSYSYTHTTPTTEDLCASIINSTAYEFIAPILDTFQSFLDKDNSTSFNTFVIKFEKIKNGFARKMADYEDELNQTEQTSSLPTNTIQFTHRIQPKFNRIFAILKKYNGKKSDQASAFSNELLAEFDADVMFKEITSQLSVLFAQAKTENNKPLMKAINELIALLKTKKSEMDKKSDKLSLFTGIVTRMRT